MKLVIFALLILFIAANVYVEAANQAPRGAKCQWWRDPLSRYLNSDVDYTALQRFAYLGFAVAEVLLIFAVPRHWFGALALAIAALGLVVVTLTGAADPESPDTRRWVEKAHLVAAGASFTGALVWQFMVAWRTPIVWFPIAGVAGTLAFARWAPKRSALEEKYFLACLLGAFLALIGPTP